MGIVRTESVKSTFFSYVGVVIGFISQTFIYTNLLSTSVIGLIKIIQSFANLYSHLSLFNLQGVTLRFFPFFRDKEKGHNGFLFFILMFASIGFIVFFIITIIFREQILSFYLEKSSLFADYFYYVFPIVIATSLMTLLNSYLRSLYRIVYATIVKDIYIKVFSLIAILLYYFRIINFDGFMIAFAGAYALSGLLLILYIFFIGELKLKPDFRLFTKDKKKDIFNFSVFGYLSEIVQTFIVEIDKLMIGAMIGLANTGIYGVTALFSIVIGLPQQSIANITGSIMSQAYKENDMETVKMLYKKTALNQLIIGGFLFMIIWFNTDNFLSFMPDEYKAGKYVVLILASMKLFDMAAGNCAGVINMSKYYRFIFVSNLLSLIVAVSANLWLIPLYGIIGSAIATAIAIVFYITLQVVFIWFRFRIHPYSKKYFAAVGFWIFISIIIWLIPSMDFNFNNLYIDTFTDIFLRSIIITAGFGSLILLFKVSEDVNDMFRKTILRVKNMVRR